ncbi:MAG TPA: PQQ-dependent dehydrogenase, methanol/ethanol family, partial [Methyloradius sp.]
MILLKNLVAVFAITASTATLANSASTADLAGDKLQSLMQDDQQWASPRKDYSNQGYSQLNQINRQNIKHLHMAWSFATGVTRGHEGSPLVIGNIMYVHT